MRIFVLGAGATGSLIARLLDLLALLSQTTNFSVGCYCEDEKRCHRSILRQILIEHGARIAI